MKLPFSRAAFAVFLAFAFAAAGQPFGLGPRAANTSLQMPQVPTTFGYATENAFPTVSFTNPIAITAPLGETNRLFIAEQGGRIVVITNLAAPTRSVFLDISSRIVGGTPADERGLLGLAFHPGFATNGYFFVFYSLSTTTSTNTGLHQRVARFQVSAQNPDAADASSELPLITQYDSASNHNGGCLQFGPDGYLYISVGDEGNQNDTPQHNSQLIDKNFFSGILRIDVDKLPGNLAPNPHPASSANYFVPADNPFVGATSFNGVSVDPVKVRTEFYAVGFRNPWRFSFDSFTDYLYCGDVGQDTYEEVDIVVKGGNYGWAYREGLHAGPKSGTPPAGLMDPILEYRHGTGTLQGNSITGGVVYRGTRMSALTGAYVFADYVSGNLWSLRYDGVSATGFQRLMAGLGGIAAFGTDPRNGDVLLANQTKDQIQRLTYGGAVGGAPLPATLAATGAFTDLATLTPAAGIVPYDINVPFWSDNAHKTRWFSVPDLAQTVGFKPDGNWSFPTGTVWVKHFDLELTNGVPASARRLETRLLVRNPAGVYGVTYRWDDAQQNATLVAEEGLDETFAINDGGIIRTQVWHYPGRGECLICHTPVAGHALGFNTAQLNRDFNYGGTVDNQIRSLNHAGYFSTNVTGWQTMRALTPATNDAVSLEQRVRSFLAANCVQCHQPGGAGLGTWDARITTPLSAAGIVNGKLNNNGGDPNQRVIAPGAPGSSMMLLRLTYLGDGHMPPLATSVGNSAATNLLAAWIKSLAGYQSFTDWQTNAFGATNAPGAAPADDPDHDGASNWLEYLTHTDPNSAAGVWTIGFELANGTGRVVFPQTANRGFEVQWTNDPTDPNSWQPLDVPGNRPFFSSADRTAEVPDPVGGAQTRFYRVRVYEP